MSQQAAQMGCCVFLRRPRHGYRALAADGHASPSEEEQPPPRPTAIRVVVGKERRVFSVDPLVLRRHPFRVLLGTVRNREFREGDAIFVDVDAILFEHLLWLLYNDCSALLDLNLEEIIEFYSQDC